MAEIRAYAAARKIKPATVLQVAAGMNSKVWSRWEQGLQDCTFGTAKKIRDYMAENPPTPKTEGAQV